MDPLAYLIVQNRQEVNRRSSDDLRMQRHKEVKEKDRKEELSDSELASDVSTMSEDLLGDMDPDLFGKGGPSYQRPQDEDDGREGARRPSNPETEEEEEEEDQQERGSGGPKPLQPASTSQETVEIPSAALSAPPAEETAQAPVVEGKTAEASPPSPSAETFQAASPPTSPSINFDASHGFLIAEEFRPDSPDPEPEGEHGSAEVEEETVPPLPPELGEVLHKLIIGDVTTTSYRRLQSLLGRFGRGVLRLCLDSGTKVYLLPSDSPLTAHPQLSHLDPQDLAGAAYLPAARACIFSEEALPRQGPQGFHPVLFYFGYAFDHALGGEDFASLRSPAVRASYEAGLCAPVGLLDGMARLSPVHYFAHAVESFLSDNDCHDPWWTRQDLYDFDRSMYEYVEYLFKRQNR